VYEFACAKSIKLKFVPSLEEKPTKRHSKVSLLICSKQIYKELRPLFLRAYRFDLTAIVDGRTGKFKVAIEAEELRKIKVREESFIGDGLKRLVKSLPGLNELTTTVSLLSSSHSTSKTSPIRAMVATSQTRTMRRIMLFSGCEIMYVGEQTDCWAYVVVG
jgi:hypothetical protein